MITRTSRWWAGLLVFWLTLPPAFPQGRPMPGSQNRGRAGTSQTPKDKPDEMPLATFSGLVKGADKKFLLIEGADGNAMEFFCSKKTAYFDGAKKIEHSGIQEGNLVTVEARRALDGKLEAVNVRLEHENKAK